MENVERTDLLAPPVAVGGTPVAEDTAVRDNVSAAEAEGGADRVKEEAGVGEREGCGDREVLGDMEALGDGRGETLADLESSADRLTRAEIEAHSVREEEPEVDGEPDALPLATGDWDTRADTVPTLLPLRELVPHPLRVGCRTEGDTVALRDPPAMLPDAESQPLATRDSVPLAVPPPDAECVREAAGVPVRELRGDADADMLPVPLVDAFAVPVREALPEEEGRDVSVAAAERVGEGGAATPDKLPGFRATPRASDAGDPASSGGGVSSPYASAATTATQGCSPGVGPSAKAWRSAPVPYPPQAPVPSRAA